MFDKDRCNRALMATYRVYEYLRDNIVEESSTSRLLHSPQEGMFAKRLQDEMIELSRVFNFDLPTREEFVKTQAEKEYKKAISGGSPADITECRIRAQEYCRKLEEKGDQLWLHTDSRIGDIVLESHQVWYWLALDAVSSGMPYVEVDEEGMVVGGLDPIHKIEEGYAWAGAGSPNIIDTNIKDMGLQERAELSLGFIGHVCRREGLEPYVIGEYDFNQMMGKLYLNAALRGDRE